MSKPCQLALSHGGVCAGNCIECKYLDAWDDECFGDEEEDSECQFFPDRICDNECIDCPLLSQKCAEVRSEK